MPAEGMVHALRRAADLVAPSGMLIDLHPTPDIAELAIVHVDGRAEVVGPVHSETAVQRHTNADAAVATALNARSLARVAFDSFVFSRYCHSLDELVAYVETEWTAWFDDATLMRARLGLSAGTTLRLSERVSITALRPVHDSRRGDA